MESHYFKKYKRRRRIDGKLHVLQHMKDKLLAWIERVSGQIYRWVWDKRWKYKDPNKWVKGYRKWKKKKCPHN